MNEDRFVPEPISLPYTVILQESDPDAEKLPYAFINDNVIEVLYETHYD